MVGKMLLTPTVTFFVIQNKHNISWSKEEFCHYVCICLEPTDTFVLLFIHNKY